MKDGNIFFLSCFKETDFKMDLGYFEKLINKKNSEDLHN